MVLLLNAIARVGLAVELFLSDVGRFARFAGATAYWLLLRPGRWCRWRRLGP